MIPESHASPDSASGRAPRLSTDRLLAIAAVFLSLAALVVAIFQTAILREQQRASAWPHLQLETSRLESDYAMTLSNNGVGPAIVQAVEISFDGRQYASLKQLFDVEVRGATTIDSLEYGHYFSDIVAGDVLAIEQKLSLFRVVNVHTVSDIVAETFEDERFRLRIRYADVYGHAWELRDGVVVEQ